MLASTKVWTACVDGMMSKTQYKERRVIVRVSDSEVFDAHFIQGTTFIRRGG